MLTRSLSFGRTDGQSYSRILCLFLFLPAFAEKVDLLALLVAFGSVDQIQRTSAYRPTVPVLGNPQEWWRYAIKVVIKEVVQPQRCYSWSFLRARRTKRIEYGTLW